MSRRDSESDSSYTSTSATFPFSGIQTLALSTTLAGLLGSQCEDAPQAPTLIINTGVFLVRGTKRLNEDGTGVPNSCVDSCV